MPVPSGHNSAMNGKALEQCERVQLDWRLEEHFRVVERQTGAAHLIDEFDDRHLRLRGTKISRPRKQTATEFLSEIQEAEIIVRSFLKQGGFARSVYGRLSQPTIQEV